ncbi:MAG: glutamate-semialdehyde--aminomutase, partial [Thermoleophilia bacterium]|nr:glutamate-semialdehyde--aminomutase [Thermoleophilia bacterium]
MTQAAEHPTPTELTTDASRALFERAVTVTPGGVNSPVRAMRSVGRDHPIFLTRGEGSTVWDADGNEYVDWVQSWGALPLGHVDPDVRAAIVEASALGTSFGAPTPAEVDLAELVVDAVPCAEQVRFCSSGTEATMSALRLARAATGRDAVITFAGNYHGHADPFLATGGSGLATLSIPASPGVPAATAELTLQARYGDLDSVRALAHESVEANRPIAAIMLEPVAANMGVVEPTVEFLRGLRALCDELGALLVFDEVISGFRVAWGGAQERFGVTPDLATYGKIIGGGLPVGAFAGPRSLMELLAPVGQVYQAGTLSGNPLAMAAGLAQLRALRDRDAYTVLEERGARLEAALRRGAEEAGVHAAVSRVGSLATLFHLAADDAAAPRDFVDAGRLDTSRFACMHAGCLLRGHYLPASQFEALFASTTHTDAMIESLGDAVRDALAGEPAS